MWDDDDFDDFGRRHDDGEAFDNTPEWIGENLVSELFERRPKHWPTMTDEEFLPLLDMARSVLDMWLSPMAVLELWGYACCIYHEHRKETAPKVTFKACEALMQKALPEWHKLARQEEERQKAEKKFTPKKRRKR